MMPLIEKKSKVAIFTHYTPDPDAIGAAYGLKWLLEYKYECTCDIFYSGEISHPQNKTMLNVLGIILKSSAEYNTKEPYIYACVDTTPANIKINMDLPNQRSFNIVIDHHRTEYDEAERVIIKQVGSASSLVYELIKEEGIDLGKEDPDGIVASGLLLGLITDTNNLLSENCTQLDYEAHRELSKQCDLTKIKATMDYPYPRYLFELEAVALREGNFELRDGVFITFLGMLSQAKRDAISTIADKMGRMEGVTTSIVFAMIGDSVEISMRSSNVSLDVGTFVKKLFGKENAGAKQGSGGARVPLGFFSPVEQPEKLKTQLADTIKSLLMYKITKELAND